MKFFSTAKCLAWLSLATIVSATDSPAAPFLATANCPSEYNRINRLCFHKDSKFSIETQNALTTIYVRDEQALLKPTTAHYVSYVVYGTLPGTSTKVPLPGLPVELAPAEKDQSLFTISPESGELVLEQVPAYSRFRLTTNSEGRAAVSFPIHDGRQVRLQKMMVRAAYMPSDKWHVFRGDSAALHALATVDAEALKSLKAEAEDKELADAAENIAILASAMTEERRFVNDAVDDGLLELNEAPQEWNDYFDNPEDAVNFFRSKQQQVDQQFDQLPHEKVDIIKVIRDKITKAVTAVITVAGKVYHFAVRKVKELIKVLGLVLKKIGLTLLKVIDGIKFVLRWDEVLNTQVALNAFLLYARDRSNDYLLENSGKVVEVLMKLRGSFHDKINAIIEIVKGKPEFPQQIGQSAQSKKPQYAFIADAVATNADKAEIVDTNGQGQALLEQELQQVEQALPQLPAEQQEPIQQQVGEIKRQLTLKGLTRHVVVAVLKLVQFIWDGLSLLVAGAAAVVVFVFTLGVKLFWAIATLEVKVPLVSDLFKLLISNGRYELSLLSLSTLVPAVVYTYGYMLTHWGAAPFHPASPDDQEALQPGLPPAAPAEPAEPAEPEATETESAPAVEPETTTSTTTTTTEAVTPPTSLPDGSQEEQQQEEQQQETEQQEEQGLQQTEQGQELVTLDKRGLRLTMSFGGVVSTLVALLIIIITLEVVLTLFVALIHLAWTLPVSVLILVLFFMVVFS